MTKSLSSHPNDLVKTITIGILSSFIIFISSSSLPSNRLQLESIHNHTKSNVSLILLLLGNILDVKLDKNLDDASSLLKFSFKSFLSCFIVFL